MIPIHHPESWCLVIGFEGQAADASVSHEFYNAVNRGQEVGIWYVRGRISNDLYINTVELKP